MTYALLPYAPVLIAFVVQSIGVRQAASDASEGLELSYVARLEYLSAESASVVVCATVVNNNAKAWTGCAAFRPLCAARRVAIIGGAIFARGFCRVEAPETIVDHFDGERWSSSVLRDSTSLFRPPWTCDDVTIPAGGVLADTLEMLVNLSLEPEWTHVLVHAHLRAWTPEAGVAFVWAPDTSFTRPDR